MPRGPRRERGAGAPSHHPCRPHERLRNAADTDRKTIQIQYISPARQPYGMETGLLQRGRSGALQRYRLLVPRRTRPVSCSPAHGNHSNCAGAGRTHADGKLGPPRCARVKSGRAARIWLGTLGHRFRQQRSSMHAVRHCS